MRTLLITLMLVVLAGCCNKKEPVLPQPNGGSQTSPASDTKIDTAKDHIDVDPLLLEDCAPLPMFASKNPDGKAVLQHKAKEVGVYSECAARHKSLSDIVRKYWNVPKQ